MSGPRFMHEARTKHYMVVHPRVVRETGSANNALVYIRMGWRCEELTSSTWSGPDGTIWWVAPHSAIAEETGLTVEQVRHSLKQLRDAGMVREIDRGRGRVRGYSWAAVVPEVSDISDTQPSDGSDTPSDISDTLDIEVSDISDSLLLKEQRASGGEYESTTTGEYDSTTLLFEEAWKSWPRKDNKKKARDKFGRLKDQSAVAAAIISHGQAHARYSGDFVPHLITWLNGERWNDPLPGPRGVAASPTDRALATIALGADDQRAVSA